MDLRENGNWNLSGLAEKRAAQRNVDTRLFDLLRRHGKRLYVHGDLHVFLGEKMIPDDASATACWKRIANTMVVVAADGTVKTVVKDARALKKLRHRRLYWRRRNHRRRRLH